MIDGRSKTRSRMLSTVSLLALVLTGLIAANAHAVDQVVAEGATDPDGIGLADGDSLTNNGTIRNPAGSAISYPGPGGSIAFILNSATGRVEALGDFAIGINGSLDAFTNHGVVTTDTDAALGVNGSLLTFLNTGTMTTTGGAGVGVNGTVSSFTNSGTITGANDPAAVFFNGPVTTFVNSGTLNSASNWTSVFFNGVGSFNNSGSVVNLAGGHGVEVDLGTGEVGSFTNSGTITAGSGAIGAALFGNTNAVGSFTNSGTISGNANAGVVIDGHMGTFTNTGTITGGDWDALYLGLGVNSFVNSRTGVIRNTDANGTDGNGIGFNTRLVGGGVVASFENHGIISGDPNGSGNGVGFFSGNDPASQVGSFLNTGTITGAGNGTGASGGFGVFNNSGSITSTQRTAVWSDGQVGTFTNSGTIASAQSNGFDSQADVGSFTNSGTISGDQNGANTNGNFGTFVNSGTITGRQFSAARAAGDVGSFSNSGTITGVDSNGVSFEGTTGTFTNSGVIGSTFGAGVYLGNATGVVTNSGTMSGDAGIVFDGPSAQTLVNSGTIRGTSGPAIMFRDGDDLLVLQTGSRITGDVEFGAGNDTADVSGFSGSTLLRVYDLENLTRGHRLAYHDQANNLLGVVDASTLTSSGAIATLLANQLGLTVTSVLDGIVPGTSVGSIEPLGYMPVAPQTAADLAIIDPAPATTTVWATAIGGGSTDGTPALSSTFGALVTGAHALVSRDTTLGALAGLGRGYVDVGTGSQTVDSTTGVVGAYGRHSTGAVDLDFSVLAGISGNRSARQVFALGAAQTATADYASWFIAPAVGVAVPVLEVANGQLDLVGRVNYVGGQVAGYTETGSALNLTVGSQSIGLLDARIGIIGEFDLAGGSGSATLTTSGGLLAQSNLGGTTVPVSFLGQTQNAAVAGSTEFGLYGGLGLAAVVSPNVTLSAGADAQWLFGGQVSGAVRVGLSAGF